MELIKNETLGKRSINSLTQLINSYIPLSKSEERELVIKAKAGDAGAKGKLVLSITPLLKIKAVNMRNNHPSLMVDDFVSESILGVYNAIEHYDINADIRFSSYVMCDKKNIKGYAIKSMITYVYKSHLFGMSVKERSAGQCHKILSLSAPANRDGTLTLEEVISEELEATTNVPEFDIVSAMNELPEVIRKEMLLYIAQNKPLREVGVEVGRSYQTVKNDCDKTLKKWRGQIVRNREKVHN